MDQIPPNSVKSTVWCASACSSPTDATALMWSRWRTRACCANVRALADRLEADADNLKLIEGVERAAAEWT